MIMPRVTLQSHSGEFVFMVQAHSRPDTLLGPSLGALGPHHPERLSDEPEVTQPSRAGPGPNRKLAPLPLPFPDLGICSLTKTSLTCHHSHRAEGAQ